MCKMGELFSLHPPLQPLNLAAAAEITGWVQCTGVFTQGFRIDLRGFIMKMGTNRRFWKQDAHRCHR